VVCKAKDGEYTISHMNLGKYSGSIEYKELRSVMGNTFACCIMQRNIFSELGGLNENYKYCFEDLELNLRCVETGYPNFILPSKYSTIHHESYTRKQTPKYFDMDDYVLIRSYLDSVLKKEEIK
jgi:GT2 family glycosyltransferase